MKIFLAVWAIFALYSGFGVYFYRFKVAPKLKVTPSAWGLTQLKHIQTFVRLCDKEENSPWFLPFLRYIKLFHIVMIILLGLVITIHELWGL